MLLNSARSSGGARHESARGEIERPVFLDVWLQARAQTTAYLLDLLLRAGENRVVEDAREIQGRLPELLEARCSVLDVDRLDGHLREARRLHLGAVPESERPGRARGGRLDQVTPDQLHG